MGTIAQLYESGSQSGQKGHFMNLVMLMRVDGRVEESEMALLNRLARKLSLTDEQVKQIMENPNDYPMIPPVSREERYERLIQLAQMILSGSSVEETEVRLIKKYALHLGFTSEKTEEIYPQIMEALQNGNSRDEVLEKIM